MKTQAGLVSVVIISFNSAAYLERCVKSLEDQSYRQIEILVIDNGSKDGSLAIVQQMADRGRVRLFAGDNIGSSKANNLGIRESNGEFVLVLNADAFPLSDYIEKCVQGFGGEGPIGTVIGKLVSDADPSIIDSAGIYVYREGVGIDRGLGERDLCQYDDVEFIDGACCAAAIYLREMLEDIRMGDEYYDEDFFAFMEDAELSLHAALRGWKTLYLPGAVVRHVRGGSSGKMTPFTYYLCERNTRLLMRKHFALVARTSDRLLQTLLLLGRRVTQWRRMPATTRLLLKKELEDLGRKMDEKQEQIRRSIRTPSFSMTGRRSYLLATMLQRLGISIPLK